MIYTVKEKFESHFVIKRNMIFALAKFYLRSLKDSDSVDHFITDLYCLAEYCEFGTLKDDLIIIVVVLKDMKLSQQLQLVKFQVRFGKGNNKVQAV